MPICTTKGGQAPQFATHIRGFDAGHPEFSVIVAGQNEQKSARVKLSDKAALRDTSAIKLNHQIHLTPERIKKIDRQDPDVYQLSQDGCTRGVYVAH